MTVSAKAVFLDRDGVINDVCLRDGRPYPPANIEDFHLLPGVPEACQLLRSAGYLLVVATNQPDVGRGQQDRSVVEYMHQLMCQMLPIDHVEVCYDATDAGSSLRKPAPGMLLRAAEQLNIDLSKSYMVGDRWRDIDCGHSAGCVTIFVDRGYQESLRVVPDFTVPDLLTAAFLITSAKGDS